MSAERATPRYGDPRIEVDAEGISLRWYYFPFGTKRISWDQVAEVREHDMGTGIGGGRWRIWGSGDLVHWMPLDAKRPKKRWMFILQLRDHWARPCITPDDPDAFKEALGQRGIEVVREKKPYRD